MKIEITNVPFTYFKAKQNLLEAIQKDDRVTIIKALEEFIKVVQRFNIAPTQENQKGEHMQNKSNIGEIRTIKSELGEALIHNDINTFLNYLEQFIDFKIIQDAQHRFQPHENDHSESIGQGIPEFSKGLLRPRATCNPFKNPTEIRLLPSGQVNGFILRLGSNDYHVLLVDGSFVLNGIKSYTVTFDEKVATDE